MTKLAIVLFIVLGVLTITSLWVSFAVLSENKFESERLDYIRDYFFDKKHIIDKEIAYIKSLIGTHGTEIANLKGSETNFKKDIATLFQYNQSGKNSIYGMHDVVESINCDLKKVKRDTDTNSQVIMQILYANLPEHMSEDLYDLRIDPMTGKVIVVTKYDTEMTLEELFAKKNASSSSAAKSTLQEDPAVLSDVKKVFEKRNTLMKKAAEEAKKKKEK